MKTVTPHLQDPQLFSANAWTHDARELPGLTTGLTIGVNDAAWWNCSIQSSHPLAEFSRAHAKADGYLTMLKALPMPWLGTLFTFGFSSSHHAVCCCRRVVCWGSFCPVQFIQTNGSDGQRNLCGRSPARLGSGCLSWHTVRSASYWPVAFQVATVVEYFVL